MTNYKRNQVDWAIGRTLQLEEDRSNKPRRDLVLDLKRLLDLDRQVPVRKERDEKCAAFHPAELPGKGTDLIFEAQTAFCLLIGYLLLKSGMPQGTVVRVMRHLRGYLEKQYPALAKLNPSRSARSEASPTRPPVLPRRMKDMVHLVLDAGIASDLRYLRDAKGTGFQLANICSTQTEMIMLLERYSAEGKPAVVIELSGFAKQLAYWLEQAPVITRGRR